MANPSIAKGSWADSNLDDVPRQPFRLKMSASKRVNFWVLGLNCFFIVAAINYFNCFFTWGAPFRFIDRLIVQYFPTCSAPSLPPGQVLAGYNDTKWEAWPKRQLQVQESSSLDLHSIIYEHHAASLLGVGSDSKRHQHHHQKAWMVLEEVDGLKNEDVVMVLSGTTIKGYLQSRIIPSARTWMRYFANVIVIIEDTFHARYDMRHCRTTEYAGYTTFDCHNEPTYLMSRNCDNRYYGAAGPCCKVDDVLNFVTNVNTELFVHTKFLLHGDDDMYWRPDQVLRWLAAVEKSGLNHLPLVGNERLSWTGAQGVYHIKNCAEINGGGWYQPFMMNHAALQRVSVGSAAFGLTDTCEAFTVTHDAGMEPYVWLYQLYHIKMPAINKNIRHGGISEAKDDLMALHFVRHAKADNCETGDGWGNLRYNQSVAIGCGDFGTPVPHHDPINQQADMYEIWEHYKHNGKPTPIHEKKQGWQQQNVILGSRVDAATGLEEAYIECMLLGPSEPGGLQPGAVYQTIEGQNYTYSKSHRHEVRLLPVLEFMRGYADTDHGKKYDITKKWVKFTLKDCSPPGSIGK